MGFEVGKRIGRYWDDAQKLSGIIKDFPFHTTGKEEGDFEKGFATTLMATQSQFNSKVITQIDKSTTVQSVYCFGKKHRPDITFDENGIAIELKFITYAGLKDAVGQGILYRLRYKFVFLVLVISENRRSIYDDIHSGKEKDMEDTLTYLANKMNIFTHIVPAFTLKPGVKKCFEFFESNEV